MQGLRLALCLSSRFPAPHAVCISAVLLLTVSAGCGLTGQLSQLNASMGTLGQGFDKFDQMNRQLDEMNRQLAVLAKKADAMDQKLGTIERVAAMFDRKPAPKIHGASAPPAMPLTLSAPANEGEEAAALERSGVESVPPVRPWVSGVPEQPTDSLRACNRQYAWHPKAPLLPMSGGQKFPTSRIPRANPPPAALY